MRKFVSNARAFDVESILLAGDGGLTKAPRQGTVLVDSGASRSFAKQQIIKLIDEHVKLNVIKIGRHTYRQKSGIAQGSVISSLLCSLLYGEFEKQCLSFLDHTSSCLMRLIDDFLLITTDRSNAERFLEVMHQGKIGRAHV